MLSPAPKAIEELGFFNDEGVWGQEEEERRGTGAGVSIQFLSCGHCAFSACFSQGCGRQQGGESENNRHSMPLGAGQIMRCRGCA